MIREFGELREFEVSVPLKTKILSIVVADLSDASNSSHLIPITCFLPSACLELHPIPSFRNDLNKLSNTV